MPKPNLIIIHGYAETGYIFKHLIEPLSQKYKVWIPELPGFGITKAPVAHSMEAYSKWLAEFMEGNDIEKAHVAGHSLGGYIAARFAVLYPLQIDKLSLIHAHVGADTQERKKKRTDIAKAIAKYGKKPFLKLFYSGLFAPENLENQKTVIAEMFEIGMHMPDETLIELQYAMQKRKDNLSALANAQFSIRFFAGAYDSLIPLAEIEEQVKKLPTATLKIENVGHMGQFECPKALIDFLFN